MSRGNTWTNDDGLVIGFSTHDTINPVDGQIHTLGRIKQHEINVDYTNIADFDDDVLAPSTALIIPAGSAMHSVTVIVESLVGDVTSLAMGIKDLTDGSLIGADDTLVTDATCLLADLTAGDIVIGVGSLLAVDADVTSADSTLSIVVTGTPPTSGRFKVLVEYIEPATSQTPPDVIVGAI